MQSVRLKDLKCRHLHVCPCRYIQTILCVYSIYRTDSRYTPLGSTRIDLSVHFALFYLPLVVFATPPAALLSVYAQCCAALLHLPGCIHDLYLYLVARLADWVHALMSLHNAINN